MAIIFFLIIGIPIILSIGIYKYIKKKNYEKEFRLIALIPILIVGYFIFDAICPSEGFYEDAFTEVTGLTLPENREFKYKSATFPDHFGDYTSISMIKVGNKFYDSLLVYLSKKGFQKVTGRTILNEKTLKKYNEGYVEKNYNIVLAGKEFTIEFLSDNETIIVERTSW